MRTRTFFTTLLLFLLFFNGAILAVTLSSLQDSIRGAKERCLAEHYIVASSLLGDLQALDSREVEIAPEIAGLMRPYEFTSGTGGFHVYQGSRRIYFNSPDNPPAVDWDALTDEDRIVTIGTEEPIFLTVAGRLPAPFQEYTLVYQYPFQQTLDFWKQMKNNLFLMGIGVSVVLAACLLVLISRIFRPLKEIHTASRCIAAGDYGRRLPVSGRDELAGVARSFNEMAEEIQNQMLALNEAAEQKQRFIDNFAHELRTPLTAIYGYAEYLQKAAVTEEEKVSAAGYILSECKRMQGMASQLLELALLRADRAEGEEVRVAELFETVQAVLAPKAAAQSIRLDFRRELDTLHGNRELLESLLINLAENSIKACAPGGEVLVGAGKAREDAAPYLLVRDNGRGMSAEELSHITEAFYRADKARSRAAGGAGLGLSICAQIAAAHGAKLRFSSQPGKGTTAEVIFTTP